MRQRSPRFTAFISGMTKVPMTEISLLRGYIKARYDVNRRADDEPPFMLFVRLVNVRFWYNVGPRDPLSQCPLLGADIHERLLK
jgi:hypothetical protein